VISGDGRPLLTPIAKITVNDSEGKTTSSIKRRPELETWDLEPELEDDAAYMKK
jgi:hypothetical protein